jgi:hypothetical protein
MRVNILIVFILGMVSSNVTLAQTTAFTYQGKLSDAGLPANGNYDMQFKLFDTVTVGTGTQQGAPVTVSNVTVTAGLFTVALDFGVCAGCFNGANRFLEISVKPTSAGSFTTLGPRQPITSIPYAIKSLNAANATTADGLSVACVNCITSSQIASVNGSVVNGPIPVGSVPGGSPSYVQNTTSQQAASNFNISGDGTAGGTLSANAITSATQYNIGGSRVLSVAGTNNTFAGVGSGIANTTGENNSFYGYYAGTANTTAISNSFFGIFAGVLNQTGSGNSFFGAFAGKDNTTGNGNAFFGSSAGYANISNGNSFFGFRAGESNTTGSNNSFFGNQTGNSNTTGIANSFFGQNAGYNNNANFNSFFGSFAGEQNTTGDRNAFFGHQAGASNTTAIGNSLFGFDAGYTTTTGYFNSFFGEFAGYFNTTGTDNSFIGGEAGYKNTTGNFNAFFGYSAGYLNTTGNSNTFTGNLAGNSNTIGSNNTLIGYSADVGANNLNYATAIGSGSVASLSNSIYLGRADGSDAVRIPGSVVINGTLVVGSLGSAGSTSICMNAANRLSSCSSSLRYKTSVKRFNGGLDIIRRLRPIAFDWKDGGMRDVGFAAEDVARVEPLLTTRNDQGEIEGVKYGQLTTVLVNAVKEQQRQIEDQRQQLRDREQQATQQQQELEVLKQWYCRTHPKAGLCQPAKLAKR